MNTRGTHGHMEISADQPGTEDPAICKICIFSGWAKASVSCRAQHYRRVCLVRNALHVPTPL